MEELPHIINDLSMILIVAGVVTIIFKRLKQPLVLGYIMAGFLAGPHMSIFPSISDTESVGLWSQIGVIFMMFSLGLEFSFKKIIKMGMAPIIAALSVMACMIGVGYGAGTLFSWSQMDCLFLGGMLAMSSTTIIYKAFDDLDLHKKKFAGGVMSVLILEDILGILLMVVLSALAVSKQFEGGQLIMSFLKLGFFLLLWFVVGIYIIPLFLKRNSKFINSETLLIVSVGFCFALVVLASNVGYSPAFGAFMMGSIMAETIEAERIEHAIGSVKDLFGAIFFVSVGMLVDPNILIEYWLPILVITLAIIFGQSIFGTTSFILSGQDLKSGMQSGFSMAQIGEFAFIIAALGQSKGVTSDFLYPVVVAVSIVTTFLTPYMIKAAVPVYNVIDRFLPEAVISSIKIRKEDKDKTVKEEDVMLVWRRISVVLIRQIIINMVLIMAIIMISLPTVLLTCRSIFGHWIGNTVCGILTIIFISPFVRSLVMRKNHSKEFKYLIKYSSYNLYLVFFTILFRYLLAVCAVYYILNYLSPFWWFWHILVSMLIVILMCMSKRIKLYSIKIERTFRQNLSRREIITNQNGTLAYARRLQGRDLHIVRLVIPHESLWAGKTLSQLNFSHQDNILIAAVVRGNIKINIPNGNVMIFPQDILEVVGDDTSIEQLSNRMQAEVVNTDFSDEKLVLSNIKLNEDSEFIGLTLQQSDIRNKMNCMVIGFEEEDGSITIALANRVFKKGDIVWIVESKPM